LVAKDVEVAVVCQDFETLVTNAVPLVEHLLDFEHPSPRLTWKGEAKRPLIGFVT
jgi:hypothetical protein